MDILTRAAKGLKGNIKLPGDKSISHRAALLLPLCEGEAQVHNFLTSEDCMHTVKAMRKIGADIQVFGDTLKIRGIGRKGLKEPSSPIYLGNSGTSMRLFAGIAAGFSKSMITLYGDSSLNGRPMERIEKPLVKMGANVEFLSPGKTPPMLVSGGTLHGIDYKMEVSSAQVKSCILLAGLFSEGRTRIVEIQKSRDHTERMLNYLGCEVICKGNTIQMDSNHQLFARDIIVPGDFSSATFPIAACTLVPGSEIVIKNVLFNRTRTGFFDILREMNGNIEIINIGEINGEEIADIKVKYSELKAVNITGDMVPRLIDEIPVIAVLAAFADGITHIMNAEELKIKESNRIKSIAHNLRIMGVEVTETEDGLVITGGSCKNTKGLVFDSFGDHRIAMAFSLVGLVADGAVVRNCENINTSFPQFLEIMGKLGVEIISKRSLLI